MDNFEKSTMENYVKKYKIPSFKIEKNIKLFCEKISKQYDVIGAISCSDLSIKLGAQICDELKLKNCCNPSEFANNATDKY
jgi:hypothetical protein